MEMNIQIDHVQKLRHSYNIYRLHKYEYRIISYL